MARMQGQGISPSSQSERSGRRAGGAPNRDLIEEGRSRIAAGCALSFRDDG
jgi:hypothetical protein